MYIELCGQTCKEKTKLFMHAWTVRSLSFASDLVRKVHSRASVTRSKKRARLYRVTPSVIGMVIFARWNKNNGKPLIV